MITLWHWLEAQGLVKDLVGTVVALTLAHLSGWRPRKQRRTQEAIADRLDTSTPGGLHDVVHHLRGK